MGSVFERLSELSPKVPIAVLQDVDKRITDWLAHGGKESDPYIEQQIRYMENVAERMEMKKRG